MPIPVRFCCYGVLLLLSAAGVCAAVATPADAKTATALAASGAALAGQGKNEQARAMLFRALACDENCPDALYELGKLYEAEGNLTTAADFFVKASHEYARNSADRALAAKRADCDQRVQKLNVFAARFTATMTEYALELSTIARQRSDPWTIEEIAQRVTTLELANILPPDKLPKVELKELALDLGGGVKLELRFISAGKFTLGSPATEAKRTENETPHRVTLTQPFYMGKFPVTQEQYEALMGKNPSLIKAPRNPVEFVSWNDAQDFCTKLSKKSGKTVKLPTEAEWEYACRAGSTTAYYFGDNPAALADYGWFSDNSDSKPGDKKAFANKMTHPVGLKKPNAWGLYDMHGNVCEWCQDWVDKFTEQPAVDPQGPAAGKARVMRGGSCNLAAGDCRSAFRIAYPPERISGHVGGFGFRVVVTARAVP
jgi:formylglycine-generating enzyme required for sulfatase activity